MFTSRSLLLCSHLVILSSSATVNSAIIGDKRHKISCGDSLQKLYLITLIDRISMILSHRVLGLEVAVWLVGCKEVHFLNFMKVNTLCWSF